MAKNEFLPVALVAEATAEYKVIMEDIDLEHFGFHFENYKQVFTKLIIDNISNYSADSERQIIDVKKYVVWAYARQICMPDEFLVLIDKNKKKILLKNSTVDSYVIQGIARTLWSSEPDLTQEEIAASPQVQEFGLGKEYSIKVVKRWISECDKRTQKTGPKKSK